MSVEAFREVYAYSEITRQAWACNPSIFPKEISSFC